MLSATSILLVRSQRELKRQNLEVRELGKLCSALWDEQRDDKSLIKELRQENRELSDENAQVQLAYYKLPPGRHNPQRDVDTQT